jgi:hypothetical protein
MKKLKTIISGIFCLMGTISVLAQQENAKTPVYNPNILSLSPLQFTENGYAGVGLSYEHAIDNRSIAAFYLPVILEFNLANTENTGNYNKNSDPMFYVMPGIKIYPTGGFSSKAKYAVGPNLVIADGQKTVQNGGYTYPPYNYSLMSVQDHFLIGMLVNQSVNINPTPWLYIGAEFGFGFTYIDRVGGVSQGVQELVNFNFRIGYRF